MPVRLKQERRRVDKWRMAVHVICPSLRCRKILTLEDNVRGTLVDCRYCNMQFRVPAPRRTGTISTGSTGYTATPRVRSPK
jgi:hypothetical protein